MSRSKCRYRTSLRKFSVLDFVWEEYALDQQINDRGIALDMAVVENAIRFDERSKGASTKMQELTSLENPNSVQQMKQWLSENGLETDTLGKKAVSELLKNRTALCRGFWNSASSLQNPR